MIKDWPVAIAEADLYPSQTPHPFLIDLLGLHPVDLAVSQCPELLVTRFIGLVSIVVGWMMSVSRQGTPILSNIFPRINTTE